MAIGIGRSFKKKAFNVKLKGVKTKKEMEELFVEIIHCEFCNNGTFTLIIKDFNYNELDNICEAIVEVFCKEKTNIDEKIEEMINCEFCHSKIDCISLIPLN